jgi:hypothetical protein
MRTVVLLSLLAITVYGAVQHAIVSNEIFLQGHKLALGIHACGSFGTEGNAPSGFETVSGRSNLGMVADEDGFGHGGVSLTGDFFLPGSPEERWSVGYLDGSSSSAFSNAGMVSHEDIPMHTWSDLSSETELKGRMVGVINGLQVELVYSFGPDDVAFTTDVTLTNVGTTTLAGVRYMRSFDPDQDVDTGGSYTSDITVINNFPAGPNAVVEALGKTSGVPIFFFSADSRSRASTFGFSNGNPYASEAYDSAYSAGHTVTADQAITIAFDVGNLSPGDSRTVSYVTALSMSEGTKVIESCAPIPGGDTYTSSCSSGTTESGSTCTLSCMDGYTGAPVTATCTSNVFDTTTPPECHLTPTGDPCDPMTRDVTDGGVGTCGHTLAHGDTCAIACDAGFTVTGADLACVDGHLVGAQRCIDFNECQSNPCVHGTCSNCLNSFECACDPGYTGETCSELLECEAMVDPEHGRYLPAGPASMGTTVTLTCDTGYTPDGMTEVTCGGDGLWEDYDVPAKCIPDPCDPLDAPENGLMCPSDGSECVEALPGVTGDVAVYDCNDGYVESSFGIARVCTGGVGWAGDHITCDVRCPPDAPPAHGTVSMEDLVMTTACNDGYTLHGDAIKTCTDSGFVPDSGHPITCEPDPCPTVMVDHFGEVSGHTGDVVHVVCDSGYQLPEGVDGILTCVGIDDGGVDGGAEWNNVIPTCEPRPCDPLSAGTAATITYSHDPIEYLTTATTACAPGYYLTGDEIRTCTHDHSDDSMKFSGVDAVCVEEDCHGLSTIPEHASPLSCPGSYSPGATCQLTCDAGWETLGSDFVCHAGEMVGTQTCVNVNECDTNPCVNGECEDCLNSYTCNCWTGWTGTNCDIDVTTVLACDMITCVQPTCPSGTMLTMLRDKNPEVGVCCETWTCATDTEDNCDPDPCNGNGECTDGIADYTCSCYSGWTGATCDTPVSVPFTWSSYMPKGVLSSSGSQCSSWEAFQGTIGYGTFHKITMTSDRDGNSKTCATASAATDICNALGTSTTATISCDGNTWTIGPCGGGAELSVNGGICSCKSGSTSVLTARPCIGNDNWGGSSTTCSAESQTLSVSCYSTSSVVATPAVLATDAAASNDSARLSTEAVDGPTPYVAYSFAVAVPVAAVALLAAVVLRSRRRSSVYEPLSSVEI